MATKLLFLEDTSIASCTALIVSVIQKEDGHFDLVLDQTCFYPRTHEQQWDTGHIVYGEDDFEVHDVYLDDEGIVHHYGRTLGAFNEGIEVDCFVDKGRRELILKRINTA